MSKAVRFAGDMVCGKCGGLAVRIHYEWRHYGTSRDGGGNGRACKGTVEMPIRWATYQRRKGERPPATVGKNGHTKVGEK